MLARKALAGTAGTPKLYVEDVFSTYLYTGTGSTQTITNNIDLSGEGGMVWIKQRDGTANHTLTDTARGTDFQLASNSNVAQSNVTTRVTAFNTTGFNLGASSAVNGSPNTYASWTFREQTKFFDIVTYTGNGSNRTISHNLGSTPGCIIVKSTSNSEWWAVYHRSLGATKTLYLNSTNAQETNATNWNNTEPTSAVFTVGTNTPTNANGQTYVAYLFAHDAGGFGDAGSDNVISCGSYTGNGSATGPTVTLGYEPQWVLVKRTDSTSNWTLSDNMRGQPVDGATAILNPNLSDAETSATTAVSPTATGFQVKTSGTTFNANGGTYIYIAIRRGPMKTPTTGTSVFSPITYAGNSTASRVISGLINAPDWVLYTARNASAGLNSHITGSRLQGGGRYLLTEDASSEASSTAYGVQTYGQTSVTLGTATTSEQNASGVNYILYGMGRAPGFFDVVCYTGTGSNTTVTHNLGVAPELMIVKDRTTSWNWVVSGSLIGASNFLLLNGPNAQGTNSQYFNNTNPTSSVFSLGTQITTNGSGDNYVAYLFASLSGVSKIGTYTGNGSSVTVTTNFQPRFILVKRTDSTGDWIVSDSARGLVAGNDPYLELNTADAEVTNEDWVDISSTSFTVNQTTNNANVNTGTYIYLAIA